MWDDEARFTLTEGSQNKYLKLSVLDETDSKPELIGDTVILLDKALESNPKDGYDDWHELKHKGKYAGEVYLEMTFYPSKLMLRKKGLQGFASSTQLKSQYNSDPYMMTTATAADYDNVSTYSAIRPLPEQPGAPMPSSAPVAATATSRSSTARPPLPVPPMHSQYYEQQQQYPSSRHHHLGGIGNGSVNPFEYQDFGDLPAIPPENSSRSPYYTAHNANLDIVEDPMAFFTAPLPPSGTSSTTQSQIDQAGIQSAQQQPSLYYHEFDSTSTPGTRAPVTSSRAHGSGSLIKRKPIGASASTIPDPYLEEVPFSADSYDNRPPSSPMHHRRHNQQEAGYDFEDTTGSRRRQSDIPAHPAYHVESEEYSGSSRKPLPRPPSMIDIGEGQWDLSDELNAGYSEDMHGGVVQAVPPPGLPEHHRSRGERMSLPVGVENAHRYLHREEVW